MSHLSLTRSKLSWPSTWLHHANRERQIHSPGGVTTRLDVTWRPLRRACHERLFSSTGDIAGDKRTCLLAENLERLVFFM